MQVWGRGGGAGGLRDCFGDLGFRALGSQDFWI